MKKTLLFSLFALTGFLFFSLQAEEKLQSIEPVSAIFTNKKTTIIWSARPLENQDTHHYEVIVTIQNNTLDTLENWNLTIYGQHHIIDCSTNVECFPYPHPMFCGAYLDSNGKSLIDNTLLEKNFFIPAQGNISFVYILECSKKIVVPPCIELSWSHRKKAILLGEKTLI